MAAMRGRAVLLASLLLAGVSTACAPARPGGGVPADPWASDRPAYGSPEALCRYVNEARERSRGHQRWRGAPGRGEYHDTWTWPVTFAPSPELDRLASREAARLAAGGTPPGMRAVDSSWRQGLWVAGVGTSRLQVSARDEPGDWHPRRFTSRAALINTNGAARMALFYQDPGGEGPVLRHVGCGGAAVPGGLARWWVVLLGE